MEHQEAHFPRGLALRAALTAENLSVDEIALACEMRANFIETNDVCLSAADLSNPAVPRAAGVQVRALSEGQQTLVSRLRKVRAALNSAAEVEQCPGTGLRARDRG